MKMRVQRFMVEIELRGAKEVDAHTLQAILENSTVIEALCEGVGFEIENAEEEPDEDGNYSGCGITVIGPLNTEQEDVEDVAGGKFQILDWAGSKPYPNKVFDSFDDGWAFLTQDQRERNPAASDDEIESILGEFSVEPL